MLINLLDEISRSVHVFASRVVLSEADRDSLCILLNERLWPKLQELLTADMKFMLGTVDQDIQIYNIKVHGCRVFLREMEFQGWKVASHSHHMGVEIEESPHGEGLRYTGVKQVEGDINYHDFERIQCSP